MRERYEPDPDFKEETKDPLVEIDVNDSTELWLIQWPYNQLKPSDLHGKELSLKLHRDGELGSLETTSGKSYDLLSYASQLPDATVFLPSASESKIVGKISRRVSLVRYPEPSEYEKRSSGILNVSSQRSEESGEYGKRSSGILNLSSQRSEGSRRKALSRHSGADGISWDTLTSTHSIGQKTMESPQHSKHKRHKESASPTDLFTKSAERSSQASRPESQITDNSLGSVQSHGEKSKKKKKIKVKE